MKRFLKMSTFSVIAFLFSIVPAFARELTLSELTNEIEKREGDGYAGYVYIIGKYVFTSQHTLTVPDIMTGARTIEVTDKNGKTNEDDIYGEMTIAYISRNQNGWKIENPIIGSTKLVVDEEHYINVSYIDYDPIKDPEKYKVTFDKDNDTEKEEQEVIENRKATKPADPTKEGYKFDGWYLEEEEYDFNTPVTGDITLKAKWLKIIDTDELVSSFASAIKSEKYKANYDGEKGLLTLDVLDTNTSLLSVTSTGLVAGIRNALKTGDIKAITVAYNGVDYVFDDPKLEGEESEAYKKLKELLKAVTGKEKLEEATYKDLVDKDLTLTFELSETSTLKENCKESYQVELVSTVSELEVSLPTEENNKTTDTFVGYKGNENDLAVAEGTEKTFKFTGKVKYHTDVYFNGKEEGKDPVPGYYFSYVLKVPHATKDVTIESNGKTLTKDSFDTEDSIVIVQEAKTDGEKKITIKVDADGSGDLFQAETYTLDYSEVTFVRDSVFTIAGVDKADADSDNTTSWDGWTEQEGYQTTFTVDEKDPTKVKVTGLLPIFNQEDFTDGSEYTEDALYYLAFKLQTELGTKTSSTITVKFLHDDTEETMKGTDFNEEKVLYILKSLDPTGADGDPIPAEDRKFTITLDWDGDTTEANKEQYEPYTITVDWSELTLQSYSIGDFGNYDVLTEKDLEDNSSEKTTLDGYQFKFDADSNVEVNMNSSQEDKDPYKDGIKGTIKEQTLKEGTFKENKGYFVPIKISFPGKDVKELEKYQNTWTLILKTEDGKTKEYTPTEEEYKQGWVMVLFRVYENGKDNNDKTIRYQIDFDGPVKDGKGYDFLPEEYTISYQDLTFVDEETITYKYTDNKGEEHTEQVKVYEDAEPKSLATENTDYRTFDGWYNGQNEKVESLKGLEGQTLTAHWNLNVEKFMDEVVKDLNSSDTTYSDDFTDKFHLTQEGNAITIHLDSAKVALSELANTSIPGTIAYVLQKGEIKSITLTVGGESVTFDSTNTPVAANISRSSDRTFLDEDGEALKAGVVKSAKETFDKTLNNQEATATLDELEFDGTSFTIKIDGAKDSTINLVDSDGKALEEQEQTYTFTFDSDFVVVDQDGTLGAKDIKAAVDKNKYDTIYIDGDYTATDIITVTANKSVTIEPYTNASSISLLSDASVPTITATDKDYVIDVKKGDGTVTLKNLKLTGAKKAELMVEDGATVVVDNVDVSGTLEENKESEDNDDMHAAILVGGTLTATNITNSNEDYKHPTIARVTSFSHPGLVSGEEEETPGNEKLHPNAKITAQGMTRNGIYNIIDKTNDKAHRVAEAYYGDFYYIKENNSKLYFLAVVDNENGNRPYPYDVINIYYYGEKINYKKLGYTVGETCLSTKGNVFQKLVLGSSASDKEITDNTNAETILTAHNTNVATAIYGAKTAANVQTSGVSGLQMNGSKLSGTLSTQNEDGRFYIPVTLTSQLFQDGKTTVEVTNPNGEKEEFTYRSNSKNGIATVSTVKTMNLQLEAIKSSDITGSNGKLYTLELDIDGDKEADETYAVDYSEVETLEEKINQAAKNTQQATSLTMKKDNNVKGRVEKFTYQYDGKNELTLYNDNYYTFRLRNTVTSHVGPMIIAVEKAEEGYTCQDKTCSPVINGWMFANFFKEVGNATHELSLLQDVMKSTKEADTMNAIERVKAVAGKEHTYIVTLNYDRLNAWLDDVYMSNASQAQAGTAETKDTVEVEVVLSADEKYIVSMKTVEPFTMVVNGKNYSSNQISVEYSKINETVIEKPVTFLGTSNEPLTVEDIQAFYESCKAFHNRNGAEIYEG